MDDCAKVEKRSKKKKIGEKREKKKEWASGLWKKGKKKKAVSGKEGKDKWAMKKKTKMKKKYKKGYGGSTLLSPNIFFRKKVFKNMEFVSKKKKCNYTFQNK